MPVPIEDVAVDKDFFLYEKGCSYIYQKGGFPFLEERDTPYLLYHESVWIFSSNRGD